MNPMLAAILYPIAKQYIVDFLRKKSKDSSNKVDDKLVAAVEVALEGKDYEDVVASTSREIERAAKKVKAVKEVVNDIKGTKKSRKKK